MYKTKIFIVFMAVFFITLPSYSLKYILTPFRFNNYVYYEVLYKIEGISPTKFNDIVVVKETSTMLVFEYEGRQYTAQNIAKGAIYVDMPEGRKDRYLTRKSIPSLILSGYQL